MLLVGAPVARLEATRLRGGWLLGKPTMQAERRQRGWQEGRLGTCTDRYGLRHLLLTSPSKRISHRGAGQAGQPPHHILRATYPLLLGFEPVCHASLTLSPR